MRQKQDQLFQLVKSLSKAEKRYFKLFAGNGRTDRPSKYTILFDELNNMTEYDEETLKQRLSRKNEEKHLPNLKRYLYNLILKSLRAQYVDNTVSMHISEMLDSAFILYHKGLYEHAIVIIDKAEREAREYGFSVDLLRIIDLKISCLTSLESNHDIYAIIRKLNRERRQLLNDLDRDFEYVDLKFHIQKEFMGGAVRGEKLREASALLHGHPLLASDIEPEGMTMKYSYHYIIASLNHLTGNHEGCIAHLEILREMFSQRPWVRTEPSDLLSYLIILNNLGYKYIQTQRYEKLAGILLTLTEVHSYPACSRFAPVQDMVDMSRIPLALMFNTSIGNFDTAVEYFEQESAANPYLLEYSRILYRGAYGYFGAGRHAEALELTNRLLQIPELPFTMNRGEILVANALIHYELGNMDLLGYLLRSIYRYLRKKNEIHAFERVVLRYAGKLLKAPSAAEARTVFIQFRDDLEQVFQDRTERNATQLFDLVAWLESKIENRPFGEVVRARVRASAEMEELLKYKDLTIPSGINAYRAS